MNKTLLILAAAASLAFPCIAHAAEPSLDDSLIPDLSNDKDMALSSAGQGAFVPSFGGWITPVVLAETKSAYTLVESMNTVRLWGRMSLGGSSFVYIRGRDTYTAVLSKSGDIKASSDNTLDLDAGYIELATERRSLALDAGRKFFSVGTGLVVNGRGDGADFSAKTPWIDLYAFGFYTGLIVKESNPYGLSDKDFSNGAKRAFAGGTLEKSYLNQTAYLFYVMQKDYGKMTAGDKSRYDSSYYGAGAKGDLGGGVDYAVEGVYETGTSYAKGVTRCSVNAYAATASLNWYPDLERKPSFTLQYGFGSGDADRGTATGSGASAGNQRGSDKGFVPFGTYNSGYAFRPVLSNIHVFRGGASFLPFASSEGLFKELSLGARYDYYLKATKGTVNNNEAVSANNSSSLFAGQGVDLIGRWALYSDLSFFVNYGLFVPGSALPSSEMVRHFVTGGVNLVF